MKVTSKHIESVYDQSNAVQHYLSKNRRDGVKVEWEEPFTCSVFKQAIAACRKQNGETLKVIDVGSGTGDGYVLLSKLFAEDPEIGNRYNLDYLGVDISPQMVEAANQLYDDRDNARFKCADIRTTHFNEAFDVYLACGVPYSHLTHDELFQAIETIAENTIENHSRCAVVVDVLGRYSIEWTPKWEESRWDYCMSFFHGEGEAEPTWMSFYCDTHLKEIAHQAAEKAGCPIEKFEFFDRSIMVGRHTSTQHFNPELPQYRNLVNSLLDPSQKTDLNELTFQIGLGSAPDRVLEFFDRFSSWWNTLVSDAADLLGESLNVDRVELPTEFQGFKADAAAQLQQIADPNLKRQKVESMLAQTLRKLEATYQPGYGVGHDLYGVIWFDATGL